MSESAQVHFGEADRWGGWSWSDPARGEHFRRCSYCGSISPEDLAAEPAGQGCGYARCPAPRDGLAAVHFPIGGREDADGRHQFVNTGWRASWADRKYGWPHKFYVEGVVNRVPGNLFVVSSTGRPGDSAPDWPHGDWVRRGDLTPEQRAAADRDGYTDDREYAPEWLQFGHHATHFAKFYTTHLADPALPAGVKDAIEQQCGLRFRFTDDGRIAWEPA